MEAIAHTKGLPVVCKNQEESPLSSENISTPPLPPNIYSNEGYVGEKNKNASEDVVKSFEETEKEFKS